MRFVQRPQLAVIMFFVVWGLASGGVARAGTLTTETLTWEGQQRSYVKYVPDGIGTTPPLVIALHGGGIHGAEDVSSDGHPFYEWRTVADNDKVIVVYPQGADSEGGLNWHDCRSDAHEFTGTQDDVGFVDAIIDHVDAAGGLDANRIYAAGVSNGGLMSFRLAAELSNRIAGIGTFAANLPEDAAGECPDPANPTTVVMVSGDADGLMPYGGGCVRFLLQCRGEVLSAEATRDYWIGENGTSTTPTTTQTFPNINQTDMSTVTEYAYTGGLQGSEVYFLRVNGGGHTIPSIAQRTLGAGEVQNRDIEGVFEMWDRLKTHDLGS